MNTRTKNINQYISTSLYMHSEYENTNPTQSISQILQLGPKLSYLQCLVNQTNKH